MNITTKHRTAIDNAIIRSVFSRRVVLLKNAVHSSDKRLCPNDVDRHLEYPQGELINACREALKVPVRRKRGSHA